MAEVIKLLKVTPAPPLADAPPFLIPTRDVVAVEIPDSEVPAPCGVFLIELADRPGRFWTWNLDPGDLNPGMPITFERERR